MTNSVSSNRPEKYNIADSFLGVGELSQDLNRPTCSEWCMLLVNQYACYAYQLNHLYTHLNDQDIHAVQQEGISNQAFGDYYESLYFTVNSQN